MRPVVLGLFSLLVACDRLVDLDGLSGGCAQCDGGVDSGPRDAAPDAREPGLDALVPMEGAAADAGTLGGALPCASERGPAMVQVRLADQSLCVDATEVTQAQYDAFLAAAPALPPLLRGKGCAQLSDVKPASYPFAPGEGDFPVSGVSFCAAQAFCLWAEKSLCGSLEGGALAASLINDPSRDAWRAACAGPSGETYPYGSAYNGDACNGDGNHANASVPVASLASCQGSTTGLFDMSGNVWEWVDACARDQDANDECYARGGANNSRPIELACTAMPLRLTRGTESAQVGFRCCRP